MNETYDLLIVGSGPIGLACGIEAERAGLNYLIVDKGSLLENMRRWPEGMTFFSTVDKISIGGFPFANQDKRPTREEALEYYSTVALHCQLSIKPFTKVTSIEPTESGFDISTSKGVLKARKVILATGYFDRPNLMNIPGEDLSHVSHYFDEVYKYVGGDITVVGGSHSAADAALMLYRGGARVRLVYRGAELREKLKFWIRPDLENRIVEGAITAHFNSELAYIKEGVIGVNAKGNGVQEYPADFVFLLTGYHPDVSLMQSAGVEVDDGLVPAFDPESFETNVAGLYVAGSIQAGRVTNKIFIENGREHAKVIIDHLSRQPL